MAVTKKAVKLEEPMVRKRLLTAALDIFNEKGYASTSVREIVEAAGVTKPSLYYYFNSKEGIYLELMREPFEVLGRILAETMHESLSARERVLHLFDRIFMLFVENLKVARLMYSIYYGPPQGAPFIDFEGYHLKIREIVLKILRDGIKKGELKKTDPTVFMWTLNGSLNFVLEEQLCNRAPQIDREGLFRILDLIFDGLIESKSKKKR